MIFIVLCSDLYSVVHLSLQCSAGNLYSAGEMFVVCSDMYSVVQWSVIIPMWCSDLSIVVCNDLCSANVSLPLQCDAVIFTVYRQCTGSARNCPKLQKYGHDSAINWKYCICICISSAKMSVECRLILAFTWRLMSPVQGSLHIPVKYRTFLLSSLNSH